MVHDTCIVHLARNEFKVAKEQVGTYTLPKNKSKCRGNYNALLSLKLEKINDSLEKQPSLPYLHGASRKPPTQYVYGNLQPVNTVSDPWMDTATSVPYQTHASCK